MNKIKEKAIIPSLREKRRYLAYNIISQDKINANSIKNSINAVCYDFLGQLDYSKAGIMVMQDGDNGVLRVSNKYLNKVRAAIMLIDKIDDKPVIVKTVTVSGILKKARARIKAS